MGSTIINNWASVQAYRGQIENSITQLEEQIKKTDAAVDAVYESWKDERFQIFKENFEMDKAEIIPLCNVLREYQNNVLYTLQERLKTYTEGRAHL